MTDTTSWNPESYARNARFVSELGAPLLHLLDAKPGEQILDLGCGDGALTEKLVALGCVVIGVDSSFDQLQAAWRRNLQVAVMDGQRLAIKNRFDAVFTNAALHWMKQPDKVIEGVVRALKTGGRFIGEFGGKGNVETIRNALHSALSKRNIDPSQVDPWYYPSPQEYSALLNLYGFIVEYVELIQRPTKLPGDLLGWLETFAQPFSNAVDEPRRADFLADVRSIVQSKLQKPDGSWFADYVRLRFKAVR